MNFIMSLSSDVWFAIPFCLLVISVVILIKGLFNQKELLVALSIICIIVSICFLNSVSGLCYDKETFVTIYMNDKIVVDRKKPYEIKTYGVRSNDIRIKFLDGSIIKTTKDNVIIEEKE